MDKKKLTKLGKVLELILKLLIIISLVILLDLYYITKSLNIHFDLFIAMIYPCGILFILMMIQFIKLFKSLYKSNPFCKDNIKRLKNNIFISLGISFCVLIALFISSYAYDYYSLQLKYALLFISFLFFIFALAFYILSELFKQANIYKEENDLTI